MIPKEIIKKIRRIEIRTTHIVDEMLSGQYRSAFKGRGMEFEEVRQYQHGDDVRTIDWNVTARAGEPYIKLFREERELTVFLLVDISRSQDMGTQSQLKRELVAVYGRGREVCAAGKTIAACAAGDSGIAVLRTDRPRHEHPQGP
jgi:uncharacterized protein (DUF58 family)